MDYMLLEDGTKVNDMEWFRTHQIYNENLWYPKKYVHDQFPNKEFSTYEEMEAACKKRGIPVTKYHGNELLVLWSYHTIEGKPVTMEFHLMEEARKARKQKKEEEEIRRKG